LRGEIIRPGDEAYDTARKVWNRLVDKHPGIIVRCAGTADVLSAVNFARNNALRVAVRSGGHNIAGNAICDGGVVIDLSRMKGIRIDPVRCIATAQPGLTWGEFDHETQAFDLAVTGCPQSTTGIAGFTIGGGFGHLARKHGLACDNLLSADVVTADGQLVTASAIKNPDLFWGMRGGGGNFGIVISFDFQLHPIGPVLGGWLIYPLSKAREALLFYRDYIASAPDELSTTVEFMNVPASPDFPSHLHGTGVVGIFVSYAGQPDKAEEVVRSLRNFGPAEVDLIRTMRYRDLQTIFDSLFPPGLLNYWTSAYLKDFDDDVVGVLLNHITNKPSPLSTVSITHLLGAVGRIGRDETAYSHRDAPFILAIRSMWTDPSESEKNVRWAREFWDSIRPHATGGVYANFLGIEQEELAGDAYGSSTSGRLQALKNKYDPANFFRFNVNIWPARRPETSQQFR